MEENDFITTAIKQFDEGYEAVKENYEKAAQDLEFAASDDQWSTKDKEMRKGRPCLTINKVGENLDILEGDFRQNRPSLKAIPVDDTADPEVAKILTGLIRNIENQSVAKIGYSGCFGSMSGGGIGNIRVITKYADDNSFDQDIGIEPVENPLTVVYDPHAKRYDRQDGDFMFVFTDLSTMAFKEKYPNARMVDFKEASNLLKDKGWVQDGIIRVAEYFKKEYSSKMLFLLEGGEIVDSVPEGAKVEKKRVVKSYKIIRYLISPVEKLEDGKEWPSKYFPNVPAWGKTTNVKGERKIRGAVRFAKDPQKAYNYWRSATTEQVALTPKAPYMLTPKMISGHEDMWESAHTENKPFLLFNPDNKAPGGKPFREPPAQIPTGAAAEIGMAGDEIRSTMNVNLAKAGYQSNERSGKAIAERRKGSDTANYTYLDNMAWTMEQVGRIIIDLIPKIYDTKRIVRIMGEDGKTSRVRFEPTGVPITEELDDQDEVIDRIYDPNVGKYDVVVTVGPSYTTQRQEAADNMFSIMQTSPDLAKIIADLLFQYQDFPGADKIAERIRKTLPPEILDEEGNLAVPREQVEAMVLQAVEQAVAEYQQGLEAQEAQIKLEQEQVKLAGLQIENQIKEAELAGTEEKIKEKIADMVQNGEI